MKSTTNTWDTWEIIAIKYLQKNWYNIINTNFKYGRFWEIDIISKKEDLTIFIEVKYRTNLNYGVPEESITKSKLRKLKKTINFYVVRNNLSFEQIRFDVIIITKQKKSYIVKHYKNLGME